MRLCAGAASPLHAAALLLLAAVCLSASVADLSRIQIAAFSHQMSSLTQAVKVPDLVHTDDHLKTLKPQGWL